jgi:hypothetical protein
MEPQGIEASGDEAPILTPPQRLDRRSIALDGSLSQPYLAMGVASLCGSKRRAGRSNVIRPFG